MMNRLERARPYAITRPDSTASTILAWNSVPATRVAIAISSLCPVKTFTIRDWESSGRFTGRPVRMRAAISSFAVTEGKLRKKFPGDE